MTDHAAEIDADGAVLRVIVGDADWAAANLGGIWVPCKQDDPDERYPGPGWGYDESHPGRFAPLAPPGLEKAPQGVDAIPSGTPLFDAASGDIADVEVIAGRRGVLTPSEVAAKTPVRPRNI